MNTHTKGKGMEFDNKREKRKLRLITKLRVPKVASVKTLDLRLKIPAGNFTRDYQPCVKLAVLIYCSTVEGRKEGSVDSYLFSANA